MHVCMYTTWISEIEEFQAYGPRTMAVVSRSKCGLTKHNTNADLQNTIHAISSQDPPLELEVVPAAWEGDKQVASEVDLHRWPSHGQISFSTC